MFDDHSVAAARSKRPDRHAGVLVDPEAADDEPVALGLRLLREGRRGVDLAGSEAGDRGHDLEHRARHVLALGRPRQERLGVVGADGRRTRRATSPGSRSRAVS